MKLGLISIEENKNAYISEQPESEIPDVETNIEPLPDVVAPPPRGAGPSQVRPSKTTRWLAGFAFFVLGSALTPQTSATPTLLNSIVLVSGGSASSVDVAWDASPDTNVTGYAVYYGHASRDYTTRIDAGASLTVNVTGIDPSQTYYFAANAYDAVGNESDFSNEIVVSPSYAPSGINIVTVTVPVFSSTNPAGPWQMGAVFSLVYTNPTGSKFFLPGQLSITTNAGSPPGTNIVIVTIPALSATDLPGLWQTEAAFTLSYTNPPSNQLFTPGQLSISNLVQ